MTKLAGFGFFLSSALNLIVDIRNLLQERNAEKRLLEKKRVLMAKLQMAHGSDEAAETAPALEGELRVARQSLRTCVTKQHALVLNIIKNLGDLTIAGSIISSDSWKPSPGHVGLAGMISALIAMYQQWPAS
eukprot:CAMPEP_0196659256 /NCGR_PEP_ID=MMETSP1086-20130531/33959_1 /TAXON_ID=77921 /ORGANISM="Cyanoptyche  gloeocystis , Strain SAG4.97" /LENGTH=131 /DNA_ID=CAMNT_0041993145 /DNA_START=433 /DNA_END=828 /DNA_ORIENTATION=-